MGSFDRDLRTPADLTLGPPTPRSEVLAALGMLRRLDTQMRDALSAAEDQAERDPEVPVRATADRLGVSPTCLSAAVQADAVVSEVGLGWRALSGYAPAAVPDDVVLVAWEAGLDGGEVWARHTSGKGLDIASLRALAALRGRGERA